MGVWSNGMESCFPKFLFEEHFFPIPFENGVGNFLENYENLLTKLFLYGNIRYRREVRFWRQREVI